MNASTRARELRSSTMHLGGRGQKRTAQEISETDLDEALARALQAEEYNEGNKRRKVGSASDDGDEDEGDEEDEYGEEDEEGSSFGSGSMESLPTTPASSDDELVQAAPDDEPAQPRQR